MAAEPTMPALDFDLQGHRGARGLYPENTISGFKRALGIGVTTFEIDLGMTRDDVLVISHDSALNPDITRGPDGAFLTARGPVIRTLTFSELARYDVGRIKPGTDYARRYPDQQPIDGARIPALSELFELLQKPAAAHVRLLIELKLKPGNHDAPDPPTFAAAVAKAIRAAGMTNRVTVQSFHWQVVVEIAKIAPEIPRAVLSVESAEEDTIQRGRPGPSPWTAGLAVDDFGGSVPRMVVAAGAGQWTPYFRNVDAEVMREARAAGVRVVPWTVNEPAEMARLIALGVDGMISDHPDRLRAVMADKGLRLPPQVQIG
ncbi:glycerophosphodiester phosphodiesterase [Xanthobacteraceae bacterium Astr-EGSB]|uniref:glycerophosphodiester phosphodiesterase n=1 Tax=Astrobacterium formosum TaxID=3069710 RepID=UPI0027AE3407|nr:glycerophosphodiester phosphodiesterase [Xanthobacteraceae bacterium Astr-EGSB]